MENLNNKAILGSIIFSSSLDKIHFERTALLVIGSDGKVSDFIRKSDERYRCEVKKFRSSNSLIETPEHQYLLPGFTDLHIHAPQWPQLGKALDIPLEKWLQKYTFPLEAKFKDENFAHFVYEDLVRSLLKAGTTTAVYYGTIHQRSTQILVEKCIEFGQRAVVGKVVMDNPVQCPDYYRDSSTKAALDDTETFIKFVNKAQKDHKGKIFAAITPRFIPSCTDEALYELGKLALQSGVYVQTHCSESDWEHNHVLDRCGKTDTEALLEYGLLKKSTILAHGNFLSDRDMDIIKTHQAGIAHCPLSNFFFSDAVFPLRQALRKGLSVGLGTDIAGGPSCSIIDTARNTIFASRALENGVNPFIQPDKRGLSNSRVSFQEAFYLATKGGAKVLNIPAGSFETDYYFDAVLIDTEVENSRISLNKSTDSDEDIIQKLIMLSTRSNIVKTWVGGISV